MNKKTVSVLIALTLAFSTGGSVLAASNNGNGTSSTSSITAVNQQKQDLQIKVEKLDDQISQVMNQISQNKKDIENISSNISANKQKLKESEDSLNTQKQLLNDRMRAMYINGNSSYLGVILNSTDVNDFISRVETVKKIVSSDKQTIADLKAKQTQLAQEKQTLSNQSGKLLALKTDNENKLNKLENDKATQNKLIASLDKKEKELETSAENAKEKKTVAVAAINVQKIRNDAPKITTTDTKSQTAVKTYSQTADHVSSEKTSQIVSSQASNTQATASNQSSSNTQSTVSSNSIVAYASNFLGTPYVWGGTTPAGFDCSGFVQYVYAHFGISLPRVSQDQQNVGTPVSRSDLQPGDLVFFGSPAYHVGIYVGNGSYINAPKTGDVVKIASVDRSDFSGGRRVK
ncbi:C40 family peptidase [Clostridium tyrobutyricum]|uniref:C40 family peptidase n=1 Tax=Clostridium tyrobutyricum TaxID=1519 RepID=UPI001C392568|nr:C40 family peptidase [Clostridium tyrobutyricum]MBV4418978.1 C40 family peptidase [Clostridium tyrobutyricum]